MNKTKSYITQHGTSGETIVSSNSDVELVNAYYDIGIYMCDDDNLSYVDKWKLEEMDLASFFPMNIEIPIWMEHYESLPIEIERDINPNSIKIFGPKKLTNIIL